MHLQENFDQFRQAGISVFAISYDPVGAQKAFADEAGITYPLLADPEHAAIEATGILNTLIRPEEEGFYGLPYPGSYVVGTDGRVEEKLFYQHYRTRPSAATVLRDGFGLDFELRENPRTDAEGDGTRIAATLGAEGLVFMERATLYVDIDLDDGLHVYGDPVPDGYVATTVTVTGPENVTVGEPTYPPTRPFTVAGVPAPLNVFEGPLQVTIPVQSRLTEGESFPLDIRVRYQACTENECLLPQTRDLHLDVPIAALNLPRRD